MSTYTFTRSRIFQWMGILFSLGIIAVGYWYFQVSAGVKTNTLSPIGSLTSGLVGYWPFDQASITSTTARDRSTSKYNGTLTNGPTVVEGKVGQAIDLDGSNDYVTMGNQSNLNFGDTADFSISGWFYRDTFTTDDVIISKINGSIPGEIGYGIYIDGSGDLLRLRTGDGLNTFTLSTNTSFTTSQWVHFVAVWDQDSLANTKFYINGQAVSSSTSGTITSVTSLIHTPAFMIGDFWSTGSPFDGKIDDIRVYNRVLTAAEVTTLYDYQERSQINTGASQPQGGSRLDSGLAAYWKFDDGTSGATPTSAADASTNGNTGTLTNGPTWGTGQIGNAVTFDGSNDYISYANNIEFNSADFTVSAWFKLTGDAGGIDGDAMIFTQREDAVGNGQPAVNMFVKNSDDKLRAQIRDNVGAVVDKTGATTISQGQWYHAAIVKTSSQLTLYVNGMNDGSISHSLSGDFDTGADYRLIGKNRYTGTDTGFLTGSVDEVRVYTRSLSADEVANLYRLTSPTGTDTGLKGYWSFNGKDVSGTTAYDRSGAGNTGTLTNGPSVIPGKVGQALSFDGSDDYVTVADSDSLDLGTGNTYAAWVKISSLPGTMGPIIGKFQNSNEDKVFSIGSDGKFCYYLYNVFGGSCLYSNTVVALNTWYYAVATYDGSTAKIYINGVLDNSKSASGNIGDGTGAFEIGRHSNGGPYYLTGQLDEVRAYDRALSASEVQSLYQQGQSDETNTGASQPQGGNRLDSGLIAYYPLDDGTSGATPTTATDTSTNGNTGTLTNGPTWTTGQIGNAVSFDGFNDYIALPQTTTPPNQGTISVWVNTTATINASQTYQIFETPTAPSGNYLDLNFASFASLNRWTFNWRGGFGTVRVAAANSYTSNASLQQWHHVVVTWDVATQANFYIDGSLQVGTGGGVSNGSTSSFTSGTYSYAIAKDYAGTYFPGKLDEFRLYNRVLSTDEIANLYRLTTPTGTDTSLKGYWSFNGKDVSGTTAYDRSGAGNTGTTSGSPSVTPGKIGQGIALDGDDDYVSIADANSIDYDYNQDFSFSVWVKIPSTQADTSAGDNYILEKWNGSGGYPYVLRVFNQTYGVSGDRGKVRFVRYDGTNNPGVDSTSLLNDNLWHHVVGTKSGSQLRIYVDGASQATATDTTTTTTTNTSPLYIGTRGGTTRNFTGSVDELRLYNTTLSASQVAALYNQGR